MFFLKSFFSKEGEVEFSENLPAGIYEGMTITYSLAQIAVYMGYKEIYFLGVDNNFVVSTTSKDSDKLNYFSEIKPIESSGLNQARTDITDKAYKLLNERTKDIGVKVYNATRGGRLEVYERVEFDTLF